MPDLVQIDFNKIDLN